MNRESTRIKPVDGRDGSAERTANLGAVTSLPVAKSQFRIAESELNYLAIIRVYSREFAVQKPQHLDFAEDEHNVFGTAVDCVWLVDVVGEVVGLGDFQAGYLGQQRPEFGHFVGSILHVVDDPEPLGRSEHIDVQAEMFQSRLSVDALGPHVRIDDQISFACGPALLLHRLAGRWFQVDPKNVQSALVQPFGHAFQMSLGLLLGWQVAECVDHVEARIKLLSNFEVRHVSDNDVRRQIKPSHSLVAEFHRLWIQVVPRDFVTISPKLDQQTTCPTRWLKQSLHFALCMLRECGLQKLRFRSHI